LLNQFRAVDESQAAGLRAQAHGALHRNLLAVELPAGAISRFSRIGHGSTRGLADEPYSDGNTLVSGGRNLRHRRLRPNTARPHPLAKLVLRNRSQVLRFLLPLLECLAQTYQLGLMLLGLRQVLHLM